MYIDRYVSSFLAQQLPLVLFLASPDSSSSAHSCHGSVSPQAHFYLLASLLRDSMSTRHSVGLLIQDAIGATHLHERDVISSVLQMNRLRL